MAPTKEMETARQQLVQVEAAANDLALELASSVHPAVVDFLKNFGEAYNREKGGWPFHEAVIRCSQALTLYDQYKDARVQLANASN